jgi:hypothetical protein
MVRDRTPFAAESFWGTVHDCADVTPRSTIPSDSSRRAIVPLQLADLIAGAASTMLNPYVGRVPRDPEYVEALRASPVTASGARSPTGAQRQR